MRKVSNYQQIWEALKKYKYCVIECNERDKKKLRKAVIKRKDTDVVFKRESNNKYKLFIDSERAGHMTFKLQIPATRLSSDDF